MTWRQSILLLADTEEIALIDFCNNLKKGGLYIIGTTIIGDFADQVEVLRRIKHDWMDAFKAFPQTAVSHSKRAGFENLVLLSGLGAMEPSTIVLPMLRIKQPKAQVPKDDEEDQEDVDEEEKLDDDDEWLAQRQRKKTVAQESLKSLVQTWTRSSM